MGNGQLGANSAARGRRAPIIFRRDVGKGTVPGGNRRREAVAFQGNNRGLITGQEIIWFAMGYGWVEGDGRVVVKSSVR
jgi:hypothetical protein